MPNEQFKDRISTYPNRRKITVEGETIENGKRVLTAYVEMADEPTEVGTPISAATFNGFQSQIDTGLASVSAAVQNANNAAQSANDATTAANTAIASVNAKIAEFEDSLEQVNNAAGYAEEAGAYAAQMSSVIDSVNDEVTAVSEILEPLFDVNVTVNQSNDYVIDHAKRIALSRQMQDQEAIVNGRQYMLRSPFNGKGSFRIRFKVSDYTTSSVDAYPSISVMFMVDTAAYMGLFVYPLSNRVHVRKQGNGHSWESVASASYTAGLFDLTGENVIEASRKVGENGYVYELRINGQTVISYSDTESFVGENFTFKFGSIGSFATFKEWTFVKNLYLDSDMTFLKTSVNALLTRVSALEAENASLAARVTALETLHNEENLE